MINEYLPNLVKIKEIIKETSNTNTYILNYSEEGLSKDFLWDPGQFMMVGVYGQLAYFDYANDFSFVALGSYPIAKDALLVQSLGTLIGAMQDAVSPDIELPQPNFNILKIIGR